MAWTYAGHFFNGIESPSGAALPLTGVTVFQAGTSTLAALFTDRTMGTGSPNPLSTDTLGNLSFWVVPGNYELLINGARLPVPVLPDPSDPAFSSPNVVGKTSAYTAAVNDFVLANATSGSFTVTLPAAASGARVSVNKVDPSGNAVTVTGGTIDGVSSQVLTVQWASLDFISDGTNWYIR